MKLADYLKLQGLTAANMADILGVTRPHMYMLLQEKRRPSLPMAVKICKVTDGLVPCYVWVDGEHDSHDGPCYRNVRSDAASGVVEAAAADDGGVDEQFDAVFRAAPRHP